MGRLENKIAVVVGAGQSTGSTIGNGRATAVRFAQEGATLLLVDKDEASLVETLLMVEDAGARASTLIADITEESQCESISQQCVERYGRIDVLHNNVGIGRGDRGATSMDVEVWDRIMQTNVKSIMMVCKHALPVMRAQGDGAITNISSVAAVCSVGLVAYKTSKAALNAYTHALATSSAKFGVRANVIMPGLMNTPMAVEGLVNLGQDRKAVVEKRDALVPLGAKMGTAWDVANAALFLASDEAKFITGVCLPVDGGQAAQIG